MVLIDSTYKTTCYELPLLVFCVPTNVGYVNVASLMVADETTETLREAVKRLKDISPDWQPTIFMTDFHEGQIDAVEAVFPGV